MTGESSEFWTKAYQARDKLEAQLLHQPEISLIDLGYNLGLREGESREEIVLRIHLRQPVNRQSLDLPEEVDGIPVRLVSGDYRPE